MWQSPGPLPDSERTQTLEVGRSCFELKPCQREIASNEIQEKKYRESSNIKARVSDGLSATQNGLGVADSFSTLQASNPYCRTYCDPC